MPLSNEYSTLAKMSRDIEKFRNSKENFYRTESSSTTHVPQKHSINFQSFDGTNAVSKSTSVEKFSDEFPRITNEILVKIKPYDGTETCSESVQTYSLNPTTTIPEQSAHFVKDNTIKICPTISGKYLIFPQ